MQINEVNNEILEELEDIYGVENCKEHIKSYATYISLKKNKEVKFGTCNVLIKNNIEHNVSQEIVKIIFKLLKANKMVTNYKYLTLDEIEEEKKTKKKSKEIKEDLLIIDTEKFDEKGFNTELKIKKMMKNFPNKVFVLVDGEKYGMWDEEDFGDIMVWNFEIKEFSRSDKEKYIKLFFKKNLIKLDKNCNLVNNLKEKEFSKIKSEVLSILIECKAKNIKKLTDDVMIKDLNKKNYKKYKKQTVSQELNSMIGIKEVKKQVEQIIHYIKVNKGRGKMPMMHTCFLGNPGTGKTSVARILGELFEQEQILSDNATFVEIHARDLIAKYVGWTAATVKRKIKEAEGGVLFIDEAYSLNPREHRGFEDEAIATLIKEMEDKRDNLCVIFAGYTEEMEELLKSNPGFESRIQFKVNFPDYTEEEMYKIFKNMTEDEDYKVSKGVKEVLKDQFKKEREKENFSNARYVRNIFEKVKFEQADRVGQEKDGDINLIKKCDVLNVIKKLEVKKIIEKKKIGFAS